MAKRNGYYTVGTLRDDAYLVAKTFLALYDIDALRNRVKKECSTDPALRWGWFMEQMLADFDDLLQNEVDCESCWVEPEAYDNEEVMDLVPVYVKELCDADICMIYHPDILKMFHDALEEKIVRAALEGHYDFLYADDEGINARNYIGYNASH